MIKTVLIRLGKAGKIEPFHTADYNLKLGDRCLVQADRGEQYGSVVESPKIFEKPCDAKNLSKVIRTLTQDDLQTLQKNKEDVQEKMILCKQIIRESKLAMKLVDMEYTFDRAKVVCYFTAEQRIDFRKLVMSLAKQFRLRIELRQIGVRDEARLVGGDGRCGRELCCSSHLRTFHSVSIQMAKRQNLPIVPSKVSGVCGRLMCCLAYEHSQYKQLANNLYRKGTELLLNIGDAIVIDSYILKQTLLVEVKETGDLQEVPLSAIKKVYDTKQNVNKNL